MLGLTKKRDIIGGDFTYGEYLSLVQILSNEKQSDVDICKAVMKILHDEDVTDTRAVLLLPYCKEVNDGIVAWIQREQQECNVPPTPEQVSAGLEQLNKECGTMGSVVSLAEQFGWTFEHIYSMPYTDVFSINKVNAARAKYERRLQRVLKQRK